MPFGAGIEGVTIRDKGSLQCGIVTFEVEGIDAHAVKAALAATEITVNVTLRQSTLLDMAPRGIDAMVRASVHYFNTDDEIDRTGDVIAGIARESAEQLR